ncbi:MAG: hypothetical protein J7M26_08515 [Armatimonadetes bacterium]|nr:hypothetical protein [Armatimonadota bacterium]
MTRSQPVVALRPRAAVRRYVLMKLGLVAALLSLLGLAYLVYARQASARQWRLAERRLRTAVPAFSDCTLHPVGTSQAGLRAAELSDARGVFATVVLRDEERIYVSFLMPGLPYRPATDRQVEGWLDEKPPDEPHELRMLKHGLGALRALWPSLPASGVHVDKIEAVSRTARQATLLLSLPTEAGRLGAAEEVDLYQYRLLAVELRFGL